MCRVPFTLVPQGMRPRPPSLLPLLLFLLLLLVYPTAAAAAAAAADDDDDDTGLDIDIPPATPLPDSLLPSSLLDLTRPSSLLPPRPPPRKGTRNDEDEENDPEKNPHGRWERPHRDPRWFDDYLYPHPTHDPGLEYVPYQLADIPLLVLGYAEEIAAPGALRLLASCQHHGVALTLLSSGVTSTHLWGDPDTPSIVSQHDQRRLAATKEALKQVPANTVVVFVDATRAVVRGGPAAILDAFYDQNVDVSLTAWRRPFPDDIPPDMLVQLRNHALKRMAQRTGTGTGTTTSTSTSTSIPVRERERENERERERERDRERE